MISSFTHLAEFLNRHSAAEIFILSDSAAAQHVLPVLLDSVPYLHKAPVITIASGDENKNLEGAATVWDALSKGNATRHSILINLGGGVITDLGGFVAATFKRGIKCINIPTTLLAMADASVGGKTGINFKGLKNEIGVFSEPDMVIIEPAFLRTLPQNEFLNGYAEMLKAGMIADTQLYESLLATDISQGYSPSVDTQLIRCIEIKKEIVISDPEEKGLRKVLNYGHTAGHAFESAAMKSSAPVKHGTAVAWGLVTETVLSHLLRGLESMSLYPLASFVKDNYPDFPFRCKDYDHLIGLMAHDKKNLSAGEINFTLLDNIGKPVIDNIVAPDMIRSALDITQDLLL